MNSQSEWNRWQSEWRQQPAADIDKLLRHTRRKRLQMQAVVAFECLVGVFAAGQLVRMYLLPGVTLRWKVWIVLAALLFAVVAYLEFRMRRGTWAAATENVADLLRLTARRARAGIRLAWLGITGMAVLVAITLPIAAPWLAPSRWQHDPALQRLLLLQIGANGVVILVALVSLTCYILYLRRRLRRIQTLLQEYTE